jgi:hypothetical protein
VPIPVRRIPRYKERKIYFAYRLAMRNRWRVGWGQRSLELPHFDSGSGVPNSSWVPDTRKKRSPLLDYSSVLNTHHLICFLGSFFLELMEQTLIPSGRNSNACAFSKYPIPSDESRFLCNRPCCYRPNMNPKQRTRQQIDLLIQQCGWIVQSRPQINLSAETGVAIPSARGPIKDRASRLPPVRWRGRNSRR